MLFDWDGCLALNNRPRLAALALLAACGERAAVVSNNSTNLPEDFAGILAQAGVPLPSRRIFLAGAEALAHAADGDARRVLILGDPRMRAHGRRLGLSPARGEADLVVLLRDTRFSYSRLHAAANSLRRGARLIVANPDLTHPEAQGAIAPETGALLAALNACVAPRRLEAEVIGKPFPRLFERAVAALGATPETTVMIGDNPATDMAGAAAFGMYGVLVGPDSELDFDDLLAEPADLPRQGRLRTA